jgi:hypothetical protein
LNLNDFKQTDLHTDRPDSTFELNALIPLDSGVDIFWARTWDSVFKQEKNDTIYVIKDVNIHWVPLKKMLVRSWIIDTSNSQ